MEIELKESEVVPILEPIQIETIEAVDDGQLTRIENKIDQILAILQPE